VDALVGERSLSGSVTVGADPDAPELREQSEELARLPSRGAVATAQRTATVVRARRADRIVDAVE
jgi:hypothetical protein